LNETTDENRRKKAATTKTADGYTGLPENC
jgi:hypothetical protein